jgi:hypothetical protein
MTNTARSHYALDLDEIERQIREASEATARGGQKGDPLADLARIVGDQPHPAAQPAPPRAQPDFDDRANIEDEIARILRQMPQTPAVGPVPADDLDITMQSLDRLLKGDRAAPANHPAPPAAPAEPYEDWDLRRQGAEQPRRQFDFDAELAQLAASDRHLAGGQREAAPSSAPDAHDHAAVWHEAHGADAGMGAADPEPSEPPRSRRRPLVLAAVVLGVVAVGVGGALSMRGSGSTARPGAPPVIQADGGPTKIAPANPGGLVVPDQNKQVLQRSPATGRSAATVVNSEEEPVDLRAVVRREAALNTAAAPAAAGPAPATDAAAPSAGGAPGVAEPRRVKTVAIKPPEPVIAAPPPVAAVPPVTAPASTGSVPAASAPSSPSVVAVPPAANPPPSAASPSAAATAAPADPARPKMQGSVREPARAADAPQPAAAPLQITPPARAPRRPPAAPPTRVAAIEPPQPTPGAVVDANARASGATFVVQVASEGSEQTAEAAASRIKGRFAELGSYGSSVQRREVGGKMRYRVRFGAMSRADAAQLCATLKSKGQDCILQPN